MSDMTTDGEPSRTFSNVTVEYHTGHKAAFPRSDVGLLVEEMNRLYEEVRQLQGWRKYALERGLCKLMTALAPHEGERLMAFLGARRSPLPPQQGTFTYDVTVGARRMVVLTYKAGEEWNFGVYAPEVWDEYEWEQCT